MNRDRLWNWQHRYAPYLFVLPFVLLFAVFMLYPLVRSIVLSLYKSAGPRHQRFVGLANYAFLLRDRLFWWAVINTTLFTAAYLLIQVPASLGLALLLNSRFVRFRNFFRFSFFSTYLVGQVFVAVLFALLLGSREGLVNQAIKRISPDAGPINWLSDPRLAMLATLIASLWLSIGFGMIYFLAALQAVDHGLYEAASVDGAGRWSRFWHVTLPGIRPVLVFMILIGTIGAFQLFELPYVLFQGPGPSYSAMTIVMYLYMTGFEVGDLGYAAAIGWMLVLIILAVSLAQLRVTGMGRET